MESNDGLSATQIKKLHQLEHVALMLDHACRIGEVMMDDVDKAQNQLNKIAEEFINEENLDPRAYIIYEVQALIYWVSSKENDAYNLIASAIDVKGDSNLFTQTGNELLETDRSQSGKRSGGRWIALVLGVIATFIGGLATMMWLFYLLPGMFVSPLKVIPHLLSGLVWLIGGLALIKYGK